jgi:hypothetical protein
MLLRKGISDDRARSEAEADRHFAQRPTTRVLLGERELELSLAQDTLLN